MEKRQKELRSILILLLRGMNFSKVRIMLTMAIIAAHQVEEEMCEWATAYYKREGTITPQAFMSKLNELTEANYPKLNSASLIQAKPH